MSEAAARASTPALLWAFVVLAALMQALDSTIANVALTRMGGDLAAASDQLNWVLTSYIVAAAIVTPMTGWLERRFGRRNLFVFAAIGFIAASALCGMAGSIEQIVFFRALQGVFGAPLVPLAQAVLFSTAPPGGRGRAMALFGIGIMLGPIIGPALGGWLCDVYNWRYVFYVNVPIGLVAAAGLWATLPPDTQKTHERFDFYGFAYLSLAVGALQMFLDRGSELNWFESVEIQVEFGLAILGFYLFVVHTLTAERPLINPRVFADRNLLTGLVLMFIIGAVLLATLSLLSPFIENLMSYPVQTAGLVLAPRGFGTMAAMILVGRLTDRMDPRYLLLFGLLVTIFALHQMTYFSNVTSAETLIWTGIVQGFGLGFVIVPLSTVAFATLDGALRTDGTAMYSLIRNVGSSVGISITSYLVTRTTTVSYAILGGYLNPFAASVKMHSNGLPLDTPAGAEAANLLLLQQSEIIAYTNTFWFMTVVVICVLPLIALVRRPQPAAPNSAKQEHAAPTME